MTLPLLILKDIDKKSITLTKLKFPIRERCPICKRHTNQRVRTYKFVSEYCVHLAREHKEEWEQSKVREIKKQLQEMPPMHLPLLKKVEMANAYQIDAHAYAII